MLGTKMQTLLAVVEAQNFTRAAQALSMTQPAVSHHIKQLEEELGAPLFVRCKTGLRLTPQGEIAVKYARRLKALDEKLHLELEKRGDRAHEPAGGDHPHLREQSHHRRFGKMQQRAPRPEHNDHYGHHKKSL